MRSAVIEDRKRITLDTGSESLVQQSEAASCEINNIMAKYERSGVLEHVRAHPGGYGDYGSGTDFHEAMNLVTEAQQMFNGLPANVRKHFGNSAEEFLSACSDPERQQELVNLGLTNVAPDLPIANDAKPAPEAPVPAPAAPEETTPPEGVTA